MDEAKLQALSEIILPPGSTSADLQATVDSAALGDVIIISGDMPFTNTVTIPAGKEITMQSDMGNNWVMSQSNANIRHFNVSGSLTLQNITLDGGSAGGGIDMLGTGSLLTLKDGAVVKNCMNTGNGGGINANDGIVTIDGGDVIHNISGGSGGGIYAIGLNSSVQLLNGTINNNNAKGAGGGACATNMTMRGGSINYNYTDGGSGGGLYILSALEMTDGEISYNEIKPPSEQSTASGGGLYCSGTLSAPTTISGGRIHHNKVGVTPGGSRGGGICVFRGVKFFMDGGEVYENEATWGGGLFFDAYMQYGIPEENTVITGNTFIHDNHGTQGGGICFYNNVPGDPGIGILGMAPQVGGNVRITGNSASNGGGILFYPYLGASTRTQLMMNATISDNVEISGNKAAISGAGVLIRDDNRGQGVIAALTITGNVTIRNNEITTDAGAGGGIYGMNSDIEMQSKVQVSNNIGYNFGGGIYLVNSILKMLEGTVSGNTANSGGGIYIRNSNLFMEGSIVNGNTAKDGSGGGIYLRDNGNAEVRNGCSITNNHAPNGDGGGIFTEDAANYGNLVTDESTVFRCNSAEFAYNPPQGASALYPDIRFSGTSITDHPLNNFDINYMNGDPIEVTFNVTYNANGGVGSHVGPDIEAGSTDTVLSLSETGISRTDYIFTNWNTEPDGSGASYTPGDTIILTCSTVLFAQWAAEPVIYVTYDCNGGSGGYIDPCRGFDLQYAVLPLNQTGISRTGFTFTDWNLQPDGSGTSYAPGDIITIANDITLYAQWREELEYAVTYDCNGGNGRYVDHCREFDVNYMVLSTSQTGISYTGYTFTVWSTEPDGSGVSYAAGQLISVSSDMVLYAQWRQFPEQKRLCRAPEMKCRKAIEGQILWVDNDNAGGTRPPSVEILLLRDGEVYKRINVDSTGDGYWGFCCMPVWRNASQKYKYQIDETPIPGYTTAIEGYNVINTLTP